MIEKLILSNKLKFRLARHLLYWFLLIFFVLHYYFTDFSMATLTRVLSYLPFYVVFTYFLLFIITKSLDKKRYFNLLLYFILIVLLDLVANEFTEYLRTGKVHNHLDTYWEELIFGIEFSVILYAIPSSLKILKYFYVKTIRIHELEQLNKENQIRMLTDQLNPHFLFNALATIRALIGENNNDAKLVVNEMSEYFRYSLLNKNKNSRTLEEELSVVRNYIEIQKIRFKSNFQVKYNIDEMTKKVLIPVLAVQNLVENAIKYGSRNKEDCLEIEIQSIYTANQLRIKVINSGTIQERKSGNISTKTGLDNLQKRLDILYPNTNSFNLYEKEGYVYAVITLIQTLTTDESLEHHSSG